MTPAHRIRLRGSWEVTPLEGGRTRHLRRFGRPRTIDPGETVWLVGESVPGAVVVLLNGGRIGEAQAGQPFAFDATSRLNPRNELVIEVSAPADAPLGEVAVEIRPRNPHDAVRPEGASFNSQG